MSKRIVPLIFALATAFAWAQEDSWDEAPAAPASSAEVSAPADSAAQGAATSSSSVAAPASSAAPVSREVAVRYCVSGDSVEQEAIFVKIEKDTVYLKAPTEADMKKFAKLEEKANVALQESNGQEVEEDEDEEV